MIYMLDTDVCIYIINQHPISYLNRLELIEQNGVCQISSIVLAELYYGIANSKKKEQNQIKLNLFLEKIEIKPYNEQCAYYYGEIRAALTKKGQLIGNNDLLIASHALCEEARLVTNNVSEFNRIPGLLIENWQSI